MKKARLSKTITGTTEPMPTRHLTKWRSATAALVLFACGSRSDLSGDDGSPGNRTSRDAGTSSPTPFADASALADAPATPPEPSDGSAGDGTGKDPSIASSYLINPAHTGYVDTPSLVPPLTKLWEHDFGRGSSYALIVKGLVYVITGIVTPGFGLTAFDARTGATVWGPINLFSGGSSAFSAHAYDGGRIFTLNGAGQVRAFDAATGASLWKNDLPGGEDAINFNAAPTAYRGIVYVSSTAQVFALDEMSGTRLWTQPIEIGSESAPAVDDDGVFVIHDCPQAYRFDRRTGDVVWSHLTQYCDGGGGASPLLYQGRVYDDNDDVLLDAATGASLGYFALNAPAAFHGGRMFAASGPGIQAIDVASGVVAWSLGGVGGVDFSPIVAGGHVYFVSDEETVHAVDEQTGKEVWSDRNPKFVSEDFESPTGLSAAEGFLAVPNWAGIAVYASSVGDAGMRDAEASDAGP
jgi:outer membrane protein assembly factor BamB